MHLLRELDAHLHPQGRLVAGRPGQLDHGLVVGRGQGKGRLPDGVTVVTGVVVQRGVLLQRLQGLILGVEHVEGEVVTVLHGPVPVGHPLEAGRGRPALDLARLAQGHLKLPLLDGAPPAHEGVPHGAAHTDVGLAGLGQGDEAGHHPQHDHAHVPAQLLLHLLVELHGPLAREDEEEAVVVSDLADREHHAASTDSGLVHLKQKIHDSPLVCPECI